MASSDSVYSDDFLPRSDGEDSPSSPQPSTKKKRIRMNLSGLSLEEKIKRRKMKNRAAAQAARDRKKCRMEEMEETIAKLSEEKLKLLRENALLKAENDKFKVERLAFPSGSSTLSTKVQSSSEGEAVVVNPFDSAAEARVSTSCQSGSGNGSGRQETITNLDDAIRALVHDPSESDDVLDWLEKCTQHLEQIAASATDIDGEGLETVVGNVGETLISLSSVSVPSTIKEESFITKRELDEIRDLIAVDHLYIKGDDAINEDEPMEVPDPEEEKIQKIQDLIQDETILNLFPDLA